MHIPAGRLIKHRQRTLCFKDTEVQLRRRDMAIAIQCTDMTFSLKVEEGEETIEGV